MEGSPGGRLTTYQSAGSTIRDSPASRDHGKSTLSFTSHPGCGFLLLRPGPGRAFRRPTPTGFGKPSEEMVTAFHAKSHCFAHFLRMNSVHIEIVRTSGGWPAAGAPQVHTPVGEGLEPHPGGERPRQDAGLAALRHLLRLPSGPLRRDRLLSFRITCHPSRNTGQPPPPWGRALAPSPVVPRSPSALWLPSPTPHSDQPTSSRPFVTAYVGAQETLLSSPSREGPSRPGDLTQAGSSPCCQTLLSTLLEPERHLLWATGPGAGTPESQSPKTSARTSQLPDRVRGHWRKTAEQV